MTKSLARVVMKFQGGERFRTWESLSIRDTFTDPLGSCSFTVAPPRDQLKRYRDTLIKGELVGVAINDIPIVTPIIETVTTSVSREGGTTFDIDCKSVLSVAAEASADPNLFKKFKKDAPVVDVILETLAPFNFDTVVADSAGHCTTVTGKPISGRAPAVTVTELKEKEIQVQPGETAYGYVARLTSRLGVALRVNWEGQLLLCAPDYQQSAHYTIVEGPNINTGDASRALSLELTDTNAGQFSEIVIRGKSPEVATKDFTQTPEMVVALLAAMPTVSGAVLQSYQAQLDQTRNNLSATHPSSPQRGTPRGTYEPEYPTYWCRVQPFKPKFFQTKRAKDAARCTSLAKLHFGKAAEKAWVLTATVPGFLAGNGNLWAVDTVCRVRSESLDIDNDFWIYEVNFSFSRGSGQITQLKLLPKGALIIGDIPES